MEKLRLMEVKVTEAVPDESKPRPNRSNPEAGLLCFHMPEVLLTTSPFFFNHITPIFWGTVKHPAIITHYPSFPF